MIHSFILYQFTDSLHQCIQHTGLHPFSPPRRPSFAVAYISRIVRVIMILLVNVEWHNLVRFNCDIAIVEDHSGIFAVVIRTVAQKLNANL